MLNSQKWKLDFLTPENNETKAKLWFKKYF